MHRRRAGATITAFAPALPQMKPARHPTALRTLQLLRDAGIASDVVEFEQPTRTSAEAAAAIGCAVAEIAKTVVFRGRTSGLAVIVVASGDNRVSEAKVAATLGEPLARADADFVRAATGYAIGGVAPLGHSQPVKLLLDQDLRRFDAIWAAAGTPFSVFRLKPEELSSLTGADWADVRL
jgi:prolyl-tRNA editing enzyme YbaK/EbsC (Cys-tRNA(Pro) deacylase)